MPLKTAIDGFQSTATNHDMDITNASIVAGTTFAPDSLKAQNGFQRQKL